MSIAPPTPADAPASRLPRGRTRLLLIWSGACLAGLAFASRIIPYQMDDAYIVYRYAENIAAGGGASFNRGGVPVEGVSSPLWLALLSAVERLFGATALPSAASLLGVCAYLLCVALLLRGTSRLSRRTDQFFSMASLFPVLIWALSPGAVFYSVTGMETLAFAAIVLAVHSAAAGTLPLRWGIVAALLAIWVRPEGAWLAVALVAQLLAQREQAGRWIGTARTLGAALVAGGVLLVAVRWSLFHSLLPNTYYAKRPSAGAGWEYLIGLLQTPWADAILGLGLLGGLGGVREDRGLCAAGLTWVVAAVVEGGDWMPEARFFQPGLILLAASSGGIAIWLSKRNPRWWRMAAVASVVALACQVSSTLRSVQYCRTSLVTVRSESLAFALWMKMSRTHSVALVDIGEVGFALPDVNITDLGGLTDTRIGRSPGTHLTKHFDLAYVLAERRPEIILLRLTRMPGRSPTGSVAPRMSDTASDNEAELLAAPDFHRRYRLLFVQASSPHQTPFYGRAVFVRRDVQLPPAAIPPADVVYVRHRRP